MSSRRIMMLAGVACFLTVSSLLLIGTAAGAQHAGNPPQALIAGRTIPAVSAMPAVTATVAATPTASAAAVSATLSMSDTALAAQIGQLMEKLAADPSAFSGVVLVARDGQPIFRQAYGRASYELDVPNTLEGKFGIASMTKSFVALAILQLQQKGLLTVDDSICKYLKDCPEAWKPITIHHLLSHQSGLANYWDLLDASALRSPTTAEKLIELVRKAGPRLAPGKFVEYNDTNYLILGYIVSQVAKTSFAGYLRDNILKPIGMNDTGMASTFVVLKNRVSGYSTKDSVPAYLDMSNSSTAAGMYSTAPDLLRFDQALYTDTLLSKALREKMFAPQSGPVPGSDGNLHYGYGWYVYDQNGHRVVGKGGGLNGFRTILNRYPDDNVTVIVLANREDIDAWGIADSIGSIIFPAE